MAETQDTNEALSTLFHVEVAEIPDMVFRSCEGLEVEIEVVRYQEGGRLQASRSARGPVLSQRITFSHGSVHGNKSAPSNLFKWFQDVCDSSKALQKKRIFLKMTDLKGEKLSEWVIKDAWPCRWAAPLVSKDNTELAVEYVSFAHEGIERKQ